MQAQCEYRAKASYVRLYENSRLIEHLLLKIILKYFNLYINYLFFSISSNYTRFYMLNSNGRTYEAFALNVNTGEIYPNEIKMLVLASQNCH